MSINGKHYDHEDCRIVLPSGLAFGLLELSYEDQQEIDTHYGRGAVPRGWSNKNYEASGKMSVARDQFESLKAALAATSGGSLYDHRPFVIISSYANEYQPLIVDTLPDVKITKFSSGYKQGDNDAINVSIEFKILSPIKWNGIPAKKG